MRATNQMWAGISLLFCGQMAWGQALVPEGPLPRTVTPTLVQLELKFDPDQPRFSGRTRIEADVATATDTIWMHGRDLTIASAAAILEGSKRIPLSVENAHISGVLKLSAEQRIPAGEVVIELVFDAPFGEQQGAYRVAADGENYIVTQMEPLGARDTFPGFDEPSFKQPWEIALIVPENEIALANTRERSTQILEDGWKKVTFERTEALPSYLIAFAVGPWDVPLGPDIAPHGSRKTPVKLRGVAAKGQGERMKYALQHTPAILHALEDYFGTPYPFDKLDNVAAPDFSAGAMENAGLIIYRDSLMFADESSAANLRQAYWLISAHELAHQWFGNLVTMKWWDDLWLNEAFATWMGTKITAQLQPQFHAERNILEGAIMAMEADSLASTRRVGEPITDFTQIMSAFDVITYRKGGATLAMFEHHVGERAFRDGVRAYLQKHVRGNATSSDLIAAIAAQTDDAQRVEAAFKSYIDQPGVPFLDIDVTCGANRPSLIVRQRRYLPIGSSASAQQTWGVPLSVRYAEGGTIREQKGIVVGAQDRLELEAAESCPEWVMPNGHGASYFRFALTPRWHAALSEAFEHLNESEQRVYADAVTSAYDAGALSPTQLLAALPQFAGADTRQTVLAGTGQVRWMSEHLVSGSQRDDFHAAIARVYRPRLQQLGFAPKENESDDDRLLRSALIRFLADIVEDPAVRVQMSKAGKAVLGVDAQGRLNLDAVSTDLRGIALSVAVEEHGARAFELAEKHFRASQDPVLRMELLGAMGSAREAKLANRARGLVFESNLLRRNEVFMLIGSQIDEPSLRSAARAWIDEHFEKLETRLDPAGAQIAGLYARGVCDIEAVAQFQSKFGERLADVEGGPLELRQTTEQIRLCDAARKKRADRPLQITHVP